MLNYEKQHCIMNVPRVVVCQESEYPFSVNAYEFEYSKFDECRNMSKLQEKVFNFPYFSQKFDRFFLSPCRLRNKTSKKKEQSTTVPKDIYCYHYCFLETN